MFYWKCKEFNLTVFSSVPRIFYEGFICRNALPASFPRRRLISLGFRQKVFPPRTSAGKGMIDWTQALVLELFLFLTFVYRTPISVIQWCNVLARRLQKNRAWKLAVCAVSDFCFSKYLTCYINNTYEMLVSFDF